MVSPRNRGILTTPLTAAAGISSGVSSFKTPSQPQCSFGQDLELPLDDTHYLALRQIESFHYVQRVYRQPKNETQNTLTRYLTTIRLLLGLIARFIPRGIWQAYLYANRYPDPLDYRLAGSLRLSLEPHQLAYCFTWRFLSRYLRPRAATGTKRKLRQPDGVLIDRAPFYLQCSHLIVSIGRLLLYACLKEPTGQLADLFISPPLNSWQQGKPGP